MTAHILEDFKQRVRQWCTDNVPADWRERQSGVSHDAFVNFQQEWLHTLRIGGFAVPHWPKQWGGGFSSQEEAIIFQELARADAPRLVLHFVSLHHAAATLLAAGTDEQRARHLPAILDGEVWCQGFSEPDAGSDLASLRTSAVREGGVFVVNGQKTWASLAMHAGWCLLLARTDSTAPKRRGISYFLLDMHTPGIEVRPIRQATGDAHFCEIFLTDVRIPVENLIGRENQGWQVAQSTLNSERGGTMVELAERLGNAYRWLIDLATTTPDLQGRPLAEDPLFRDRIAHFGSQLRALRLMCARITSGIEGRDAGVLASVIKLYYSELLQSLTGYGVEVAGLVGQLETVRPLSTGWESGHWLLDHIGSWEWTIPGGTSEIQRNIIGERGLGLPREPVVAS